MEETYAIFKVYDYKGGELGSSLNLSLIDLVEELSEKFETSESTDEKVILKEIKEIEKDEDFYSIYAGGGGFCGNIYKIENNKMHEISIKSLLPEIAKIIVKYNIENND